MTDKRFRDHRAQPPLALRTAVRAVPSLHPAAVGTGGADKPRFCYWCKTTEEVGHGPGGKPACKSCIEKMRAEAQA